MKLVKNESNNEERHCLVGGIPRRWISGRGTGAEAIDVDGLVSDAVVGSKLVGGLGSLEYCEARYSGSVSTVEGD